MSDNTVEDRRSDFIKRLFSVAASVGFATQIGAQPWVKQGRFPDVAELPILLTLVGSIIVVVRSWEGYFETISRIKLKDRTRFYLDIFIVFQYIVLLNVSPHPDFWHWMLAGIFISYFAWDCLTHRVERKLWGVFRPHSAWWCLVLLTLAMLNADGPFHPYRYTIVATFSVLAFRWKFSNHNFFKHFVLAATSAVICFAFRRVFVWNSSSLE